MSQSKILGFYVTRSKRGRCAKPVWSGFTEADREQHKAFVLEKVSRSEFDGETAFEDVESPVKIAAGDVFTLDRKTIRVESTKGVTAFGYVQKKSAKTGKLKDAFTWHGYVNGTSI